MRAHDAALVPLIWTDRQDFAGETVGCRPRASNSNEGPGRSRFGAVFAHKPARSCNRRNVPDLPKEPVGCREGPQAPIKTASEAYLMTSVLLAVSSCRPATVATVPVAFTFWGFWQMFVSPPEWDVLSLLHWTCRSRGHGLRGSKRGNFGAGWSPPSRRPAARAGRLGKLCTAAVRDCAMARSPTTPNKLPG